MFGQVSCIPKFLDNVTEINERNTISTIELITRDVSVAGNRLQTNSAQASFNFSLLHSLKQWRSNWSFSGRSGQAKTFHREGFQKKFPNLFKRNQFLKENCSKPDPQCFHVVTDVPNSN